MLAAALTPSTAGASPVAIGCGQSIAPLLCTAKAFHARTNAFRWKLGQPKLPLEAWVLVQPHRRPLAVWLWSVRRDRVRAVWMRYGTAMAWADLPGPRCVSSKEGGMTSVNPAGYYGKWQADLSFQQAYNPAAYVRYGTANHWPEREQDLMAYHGWQARGYAPWPNTAAACGLL